jgi:hypothetical protein
MSLGGLSMVLCIDHSSSWMTQVSLPSAAERLCNAEIVTHLRERTEWLEEASTDALSNVRIASEIIACVIIHSTEVQYVRF